ncbi:MAG: TonB-dependent receptor, partial [Rhodospirillaceae bacterium]|nr:TonB-dependent receptor [Rhodospirillaceae bacterium]
QLSFDASHEFNDILKGTIVAGTSKSDHDNPIQTTVTLDQFNVQGYSYDYSKARVPLISYGNAQLTNPAAWTLTSIRLRPQTALNEYDTFKGGFELKPNDIFKFNAGLDWKKYNFVTTERRRSNGTTTNQESVVPAALLAIPVANYSKVINYRIKGLGAPAGNVTAWLVPDLNLAQNVLQFYDTTAFNGAFRLGREPALTNNNRVREEDLGGFVQGAFVAEVGDMTLRGNAGVRYVETKQRTQGFAFVGGSTNEITVERKYDDWLPSANLVLEPTDEFVIRGAAAKVMSRPNLGNLPPGATVSVSGSTRSVTAGNPNLDPFRANAYDLSFEWYPDTGTLLSLALFKKDIKNFVQTLSTTGTFSANPFGLPDSVAIAACGTVAGCSPSASWNFSTPLNTPGGNLKGYELSYQQPLKFLPGLLSNTGILVNYTRVKSSIDYLNAAGVAIATNDLIGLSRKAYNATFYYEDDVWSARVSAAYRSKFNTRIPGQEAGTNIDGTNSTFNVDASIQYSWNDNLKFTLEGVNLTDEYQDQFNDSSNRLSFYHHTGREFLLGVRYTY